MNTLCHYVIKNLSCLFACFLIVSFTNAQHTEWFNVKDYGAKGDGKTLDNKAIDKAINACSDAGGGTVILTTGKYVCGTIHLKSNINLLIDAGAVIVGATPQMNAYDKAETFSDTPYQDGGHTYFHNSLIVGENLKNISITGRGMIDGGGLISNDNEVQDQPGLGAVTTGDKAIALKLCSNVLIRDITIYHGGHFAILATGCDLLTMDNLTIDTNRDGIDADCCTNTIITNCRVNSPNDDAICPKSSYALKRKVITENLIISNCEVSGFKEGTLLDGTRVEQHSSWSSGRIKFGTESNGGFRNCVVSNCVFRNCNGLALEEVDGGIMDNIVVSNITMINVYHYPIYITLGTRNRGPKATTFNGSGGNISISNVIVYGSDSSSGIQITGVPGYPLKNISLKNIQVTYNGGGTKEQAVIEFPELAKQYPEPYLLGVNPAYGLFARHVVNLKLDDVTFHLLKPDDRAAMIFNDVDGLRINDFDVPDDKSDKPVKINDVKDLRITNSPSLSYLQ